MFLAVHCTVIHGMHLLASVGRDESALASASHPMSAGPGWAACSKATLSCWIFQPMRHSSSAPFSPSAILVLFPSAVAKPATQLHRRVSQHNDIVTRQYSADYLKSRIAFLLFVLISSKSSLLLTSRHCGRGAGSHWDGPEKDYW